MKKNIFASNLKNVFIIGLTAVFIMSGFLIGNSARAIDTARTYTKTDFTAFDDVDSTLHANGYTLSHGITATYTGGTGTESEPVLLKLTGYAPIITPWFGIDKGWTTYNYVTIGIKLPAGFIGIPVTGGNAVSSTGVIRYDGRGDPITDYLMGAGSTPLATTGSASDYLDYSFAANSPNTKKDGLVKLQVIWNTDSAPEYFTIDITDLQLAPVFIDTNKDGNFDSGELSFNTIQAAIDAANSGDTINVAAGTYDEQITIIKALTIQGAGDTTIIQPSQATISDITTFYTRYSGAGNNEAAVIVVSEVYTPGNSVTLKNFKVDLSLVSALPSGADELDNIFYGNSNGTIDGVTVIGLNEPSLGEANDGIRCVGFNDNDVQVEIKNCNISKYNKNGITCNEANLTANIHNNTTTGLGSITWSAQNGIQIGYGATGTISNNQVSGHVYTPGNYWAAGILVYQSDDITISDNVVSANQAGIYISQGSNNTVDNNTITGSSDTKAGVMVTEPYNDDSQPATDNSINHNTITGGYTGIWTSYTHGNTYSNNTISNSTSNGIYSWDSDDNTFSGNNISGIAPDNGGWGIALDGGDTVSSTIGSDNNIVSGNTIQTSAVGLWVGNGSDDNTFTGNTLSGNLIGAQVDTTYDGGATPTGLQFHTNSFTGSTNKEFTNSTAVAVAATNNWWGSAVLADIESKVSDNVTFNPWYIDAEKTTLHYTTSDVNGHPTITLTDPITITATIPGDVGIEIPDDIIITGPAGWNGDITLPKEIDTTVLPVPDSGQNATVVSSIEVGFDDMFLTFNKAVKLTFKGQADNLIGWSQAGVFHIITADCTGGNDEATQTTSLYPDKDCKMNVGDDLIVWTRHFTTFTTYTQSVIVPSTGGGGGGYSYSYSTAKAITAFSFANPAVTGIIDESNHSIILTVSSDTNVTNLIPAITVSSGAIISPNSGIIKDFTNPITYTVTAENGSTQTYTVSVVVLAAGEVKGATTVKGADPADYGLKEGDLIRATGDINVYIINQYGHKRLFLNPAIFNMYRHLGGWNAIKSVTPETRDDFITSTLYRYVNEDKVYNLEITGEDTGTLRWINITASEFLTQGGDPKGIFIINKAELDWYPKGADKTSL